MKATLTCKDLFTIQIRIIVISLLVVCISGCQEKPVATTPEPQQPVVPEVKETKTGLASFYGRAFDGQKTASGETFDSDEMVAAHPTYPLGTIVRVTNLSSKDTVRVRISDRGPTRVNRKEGVIIDLSRGAAKKINMIAAGREKVQVEVLEWGQEVNKSDTAR
jgi:rare lipoprotein A